MGAFKGAHITENKIYDDPSNPEQSDYSISLPRTVPEAIIDPDTGELLSESLKAMNSTSRRLLQTAVNRIYNGQDLTVRFAAEIAGFPTPWDWIKTRIQAGNFAGIHVGDFIPLTLTDGKNFIMEIAGINTYTNYGMASATPPHIDFISRECHPDTMQFNRVDYNNGTSVSTRPWTASELYARLNSLVMNVPNEATANPQLVSVDYTTTGVYDKLPAAVQNVIIPKYALLPIRYSAGNLLTDDNGVLWGDIGRLWVPTEIEVYGHRAAGTPYHSETGTIQYPIFANSSVKRIKEAVGFDGRARWFLALSDSGSSTFITSVSSSGVGGGGVLASRNDVRVPICFRIA
jgi:hypothetical protein